MPRPQGLPKTGGRKPGTPNRKNAEMLRVVEESGITPLEYMLQILRQENLPEDADPAQILAHQAMRFEAAKAAAPYIHPKLSSVEMNANVTNHEAAIEQLK